MVNIIIDGRKISVPADTTIMEAAQKSGIDIPHLCYLKEINDSKYVQAWWNSLSDHEKNVIKSLPNFDAEIFKEITGIDINISSN